VQRRVAARASGSAGRTPSKRREADAAASLQ
jgi:hypothetical protein